MVAVSLKNVDNATRDRVLLLVEHHDWPLSSDRLLLKRRLKKLGAEALFQLIDVQCADEAAKGTELSRTVGVQKAAIRPALTALLAEHPCVTLRDMAVNGRDLMGEGVSGKQLGETLNWLLDEVVAERLPNEHDALLAAAKAHVNGENT